MPDNINKVMITNATRNNTTVSNIILFAGDNVISHGAVVLVASFIACVRPCRHMCYVCELDAWI